MTTYLVSNFDWEMMAQVSKQGLELSNIQHDGYQWCRELRILRVYVHKRSKSDPTKQRLVAYSLGDFKLQTESESGFDLIRQPTDVVQHVFRPVFGLQSQWFLKDAALIPGQDLTLTQRYLFTEYSNKPRHEPPGVAKAARCYPIVKIHVPPAQGDEYIDSVRIDYRFSISVDPRGQEFKTVPNGIVRHPLHRLGGADVPVYRRDTNKTAYLTANQAGLFRDREEAQILKAIFGKPGSGVFEAVEKPLIYEVVADGVIEGNTLSTWDNIHQWAKQRHGIVSTPGAPFASHWHWRWGELAYDWEDDGLPQFKGVAGVSGPMLDPRLPIQDLRIALVKRATANDAEKYKAMDTDDFLHAFRLASLKPSHIADGAELDTVASVVAYRRRRKNPHNRADTGVDRPDLPFEGDLFVYGFFFAHNHEIDSIVVNFNLKVSGAFEVQQHPNQPTRTWIRNPPKNQHSGGAGLGANEQRRTGGYHYTPVTV